MTIIIIYPNHMKIDELFPTDLYELRWGLCAQRRMQVLPTDRAKAEEIIKGFYKLLGWQKPEISWHLSPVDLIRGVIDNRTDGSYQRFNHRPIDISLFEWFRLYAFNKMEEKYGSHLAHIFQRPFYRYNWSGYNSEYESVLKLLHQRIKEIFIEHPTHKIDEFELDLFERRFWCKHCPSSHLEGLQFMAEYYEVDIPPFYKISDYCFGFYPMAGIVHMCENPIRISTKPGSLFKLHDDKEAAYEFAYGLEVYAQDGKMVSEKEFKKYPFSEFEKPNTSTPPCGDCGHLTLVDGSSFICPNCSPRGLKTRELKGFHQVVKTISGYPCPECGAIMFRTGAANECPYCG